MGGRGEAAWCLIASFIRVGLWIFKPRSRCSTILLGPTRPTSLGEANPSTGTATMFSGSGARTTIWLTVSREYCVVTHPGGCKPIQVIGETEQADGA